MGLLAHRDALMPTLKRTLAVLVLAPVFLSLGGCPCGFDCDRDDDSDGSGAVSMFTLGMSATALENIERIVLEIDSVTLRRENAEDVVIENFTINDFNLVDAQTFQIDLLDNRGLKQLEVIEDLETDSGTYSELVLQLVDGNINNSFVEKTNGEMAVLNMPSSQLTFSGFRLSAGNEQLTIEFNLGLSLQSISSDGSYFLNGEGARIVDNDVDSSISGTVDSSLFDTESPCDGKENPLLGNLVYLYTGHSLSAEALADVFSNENEIEIGDNAIAPYSVSALIENESRNTFEYAFGFLPENDYTVVFSCNALNDDPVDFDDIAIPLPTEQLYEVSLTEDEQLECDLEDASSCGTETP